MKSKINLTVKDLIPTTEQIDAAEIVFAAMAYVETIKPVVEGYQKDILAKHQWHISKKWTERERFKEKDRIILDPKHSYLLDDVDFQVYLKELEVEHLAHGFIVEKEYCPLLVAESILMDAERHLIEVYSTVTGLHNADIIMLDHRERYLKLILSHLSVHVNKEKCLKTLGV